MCTLLGALLGFLGSTFPDLIKLWKDYADRKHEMNIRKLQMEHQAQDQSERLQEIVANADIAESQELYQTYSTKITWVDALNGTVRPVIAYSFFFLYVGMKLLYFFSAPQDNTPFILLYETLWTSEDATIFAGIVSFYFGQRAMTRIRNGK